MTLDELERIETIFKNPPSTGVLAEHGLVLCAKLRSLLAREPFSIGLDLSPVVTVPLDLAVKEELTSAEIADHMVDLGQRAGLFAKPQSISELRYDPEAGLRHDANLELDAVSDVGDADPTPPHSPKAKKGKR